MQNGYTQCYYKDSEFMIPVDQTNYLTGSFFCDFNSNGYRLATEGEWEYCCRAGTTGPFSCIETNYNSGTCRTCTLGVLPTLEQYCVFCPNNPGNAETVGSKLGNSLNLKDFHGNVWEWCWDIRGDYPSGAQIDYTGLPSGSVRVFRGGCWFDYPTDFRSANRNYNTPEARMINVGFRLVRTLDIEPSLLRTIAQR